jgi:hypothetical protein
VNKHITEIDDHRIKVNEPSPACMGESVMPGTMQYTDTAVQPQHGDLVFIWTRINGRAACVCKRLYYVNGEWFAWCHWYGVPLKWMQGVVAVGVVVAEVVIDGWMPHIKHQVANPDDADDKEWRAELNGQPKVKAARQWLIEHLSA